MEAAPPISVIALFFDDIRIEVTGKNIFVGQYIDQVLLAPDAPPLDRLWVAFFIRLPLGYSPHSMAVKIDIPGQPPINQMFSSPPTTAHAEAPFDYASVQAIVQLRFPPLRPNDVVRAWIEVDGQEFPGGYLRVGEISQQTVTHMGASRPFGGPGPAPT